ncbi:ImmA/IrrE family metallo-endopeptidase [Shimia sp. Alg240-R146]|uniref:ImmA/IrrE family metallo-endopeptidase n=1 Tax=Shimia sp. Alg240-R146 TaxID=2993449 RepID=UPI0022E6FA1D|nr:ImmA/IrrE family metallo-endopeptidase [Shimia sp. Alg240-R146]
MTIKVNPDVLIWARETAGFTLEDAARKLFSDGVRATADEKLEALESGDKEPSRTQLNSFAKLYKRPLLAFYMEQPPRTGRRGQDFRQSPDSRTKRENAMLDALLRDVKARQEAVRDILMDDEDFLGRSFVGSVSLKTSVKAVVQSISNELRFDYTDVGLRRGDPDKLFKRLREEVEDIGIFVMLLSDLGSHHSTIPSSVFRGFAIADDVAPFIVINAKEAKPSRSFTLMHELAHIWLGATGVSGQASAETPLNQTAKIERFCNDVAGEFLLPSAHFRKGMPEFDPDDSRGAEAVVDSIAYKWSVSGPMVAYQLYRTGDLSGGAYASLREMYAARWQAALKKQKEKMKESDGPNPHVVKSHNLGNALLEVVHRTVRSNALTYTKAANLLGAKPSAVEPLLRRFEAKRNKGELFSNPSGVP